MTTKNTMLTKHPVTTADWYEITTAGVDGDRYGYFVPGTVLGPKLIGGVYPAYECVSRAQDGSILQVGWPALARLAAAAGLTATDQGECPDLTPELAQAAIQACRTMEWLKPGMSLRPRLHIPAGLPGVIVRYYSRRLRRIVRWWRVVRPFVVPVDATVNGYWLAYESTPPATPESEQP